MTVRELKDQLTILTDEGFANYEIVVPKRIRTESNIKHTEHEIVGSVVYKESKKVWLQVDFNNTIGDN